VPVIGVINAGFPETSVSRVAGFRQGLNEMGYVENQNVTIEYRWAEGRYDRYPEFVADLTRRKVSLIVTGVSSAAALAAKAATSTIPIVAGAGQDPVSLGSTWTAVPSNPSAFDDYVAALAEEVESYDRAVAFLHGDTHLFRIENRSTAKRLIGCSRTLRGWRHSAIPTLIGCL